MQEAKAPSLDGVDDGMTRSAAMTRHLQGAKAPPLDDVADRMTRTAATSRRSQGEKAPLFYGVVVRKRKGRDECLKDRNLCAAEKILFQKQQRFMDAHKEHSAVDSDGVGSK